MSWLEKLKTSLSKTSNKLTTGISELLFKKKLDQETLQELEDLLISADLGVETSKLLLKELTSKYSFDKEVTEEEIKATLANLIESILAPLSNTQIVFEDKLKILIMCGVNGNGKTTSIAKFANFFKQQNKKIMLAACDTFRAAAVDQLKVWAQKINITLVEGESNADPASVAYKAIEQAITNKVDLLMIDTAGRLHNKEHLMAELSKILRVVNKFDNIDPEVLLVLDATTGQNAIIQLEKFQEITPIKGIIVTKLDSTAKAGILVAIAKKFSIPIIAIGIGEQLDDLRPFSAKDFANSIAGIN